MHVCYAFFLCDLVEMADCLRAFLKLQSLQYSMSNKFVVSVTFLQYMFYLTTKLTFDDFDRLRGMFKASKVTTTHFKGDLEMWNEYLRIWLSRHVRFTCTNDR